MKNPLIIIGAGPGGYTAAFLAADKGIPVTLVDQDPVLGGVCLNRGCIPTKALIHIAKGIIDGREITSLGVDFGEPKIDIEKIRAFKEGVVSKLTGGLAQLAKQRKVEIIHGRASFIAPQLLAVFKPEGGHDEIPFEKAIVATGSLPIGLPFALASDNIWDSSSALELRCIPKKLLVIGGGYIGMELATVYQALGSQVTVVEMTPSLLPGADRDLAMTLQKRAGSFLTAIKLKTTVKAVAETGSGLTVSLENDKKEMTTEVFDNILVAIGRKNIFTGLGLENTGVKTTADGKFIQVDSHCRTTDPTIYAIGDMAGQPMLAHKASAEAHVAVEAITGGQAVFEPKAIPSVVFTDPELAWCGLTESGAKEKNIDVVVSKFPWAASGRAATLNRAEGLTKIIADAKTHRILGVAIAGAGAGELIAEGALAVENGLTAQQAAHVIHAHPTLSETFMEAAEGIFGQPTHIYRSTKVTKSQ